MSESILTSTKKILGIDENYLAFDIDVIMHINSAFAVLSQLGIGPAEGFMIEDSGTEWVEFIGDDLNLNSVKTYVYMRVRLAFDPPQTSFHIQALNDQLRELEWRLNTKREGESWTQPVQPQTPAFVEPVW